LALAFLLSTTYVIDIPLWQGFTPFRRCAVLDTNFPEKWRLPASQGGAGFLFPKRVTRPA
jgi:hypothetical protein